MYAMKARSWLPTALLLVLAGCAGGELDAPSSGCRADNDCKHGRICVQGTCQYTAGACQADADCPAGTVCLEGYCVSCDRDSDGFLAGSCGGDDCDDENASIYPGAGELCGDGRDNDCDGDVDPPSLCKACAAVECPPGQACDPQTGQCLPICTPACQGRECGPDGCGGSCGQCAPGEYCSQGQCRSGCQDECDWGASWCTGEFSYVACEDFDGDGCSELGPETPCPEGIPCDAASGRCLIECRDECRPGESYCLDESTFSECGEFDGDPCLEFGPPQDCPEGQYCDWDLGACSGKCQQQCAGDEFLCLSERTFSYCGDFNGDGCLEMSPPQRCPRRTRCDAAARACTGGGCSDDCAADEQQCWDEWTYVFCGQFDNDPCSDWSPPQSCPPDTRCDFASNQCLPYQDCQPDAFEPDNDINQAVWLEPFSTQEHSICPQGDHDFWLLELPEAGRVVLETSGPFGDTVMWLRAENGNDLAYDDDSGQDNFSLITIDLPLGRYFVEVAEYSDQGIIPSYTISASVEFCQPDCTGRACGPDPLCGISCGTCPADQACNSQGVCVDSGTHPGAGAFCNASSGCAYGPGGADICVENPGQLDGFCSYECGGDDECAQDFFGGCCRQLAPGYALCLPVDLCQSDFPGYLEPCQQLCLPDMVCVPDYGGGNVCLLTCDLPSGTCPDGGSCVDPQMGGATGVCLPSGSHQFGEPCTLADACADGMVCLALDQDHPGYCNRMCSSLFPCPAPFDCVLSDGQGGTFCAVPCYRDSDCAVLGDWTCLMYDSGVGACVPR